MKNIAVFASGFGSNFQAIIDAVHRGELKTNITLLVSDKPMSLAIERANFNHISTFIFDAKNYKNKQAYELEILESLKKYDIDLIVLAGYMRIIGPTLLKGFMGKIVNIHPSLLPAFKGKDAVGQAMAYGVKITGVTIHYVNEELDSGEIIAQESLDISNLKTRNEIETEIHKIEHLLYPKTIKKILEG